MAVSILYPSITFNHDGVPRKITPTFFWIAVYVSNEARIAAKLCQNAFRTIPDISFFDNFFFLFETSNGRLPPEDGSDRPQTLGKRVSGDPRHFIFRRPQTFLTIQIFGGKKFRQQPEFFFSKVPVLEELCRFTRLYRMQIENSLPDI